jgi:protein-ribulosamine 3-kinase
MSATALPAGSCVLWVSTHGASFWAITTKVDVQLADGRSQSYFLKVMQATRKCRPFRENTENVRAQVFTIENGEAMARAEFESTSALHAIMPSNISRPVATGTFTANPNKHFFLAEFRDMSDEMPPVPELVSVISEIHKKGVSPTGKFGFHVTTFQGNQPLNNSWCDTWEEWFTREMRNIVMTERSLQGADQEMDQLSEKLLIKVIPRLLRPLQTGGRQLEPTLVHGDLWHGNIGIDMETDQPVLYDCCAIYAHNECALWSHLRPPLALLIFFR